MREHSIETTSATPMKRNACLRPVAGHAHVPSAEGRPGATDASIVGVDRRASTRSARPLL